MSKNAGVMQNRQNFVAYLGHDLRSYLNAILGFTRLVQKRVPMDAKHHDSLEKVLLSAEQLLQLINKVVDLAKLESGILQLQAAPADLSAMLERLTRQYEDQLQQKNLSLKKRWHDLPLSVLVDEVYLQHVLDALLGNAVKFTDKGEIVLSVEHHQGRFRFSISDTGVGIEAERLQRLLANFAVLEDASGTGLGIAYSKALIEIMDGNLEAVSAPGKGSTFWFELELPLSALQSETPEHANQAQTAETPGHNIPENLRSALHELIREGDIMGILDITAELETDPQFADFAAELRALAKNFQINKISDLLKNR